MYIYIYSLYIRILFYYKNKIRKIYKVYLDQEDSLTAYESTNITIIILITNKIKESIKKILLFIHYLLPDII